MELWKTALGPGRAPRTVWAPAPALL